MPSAMPNFREMNKVVVTGRASQMHQVFSGKSASSLNIFVYEAP